MIRGSSSGGVGPSRTKFLMKKAAERSRSAARHSADSVSDRFSLLAAAGGRAAGVLGRLLDRAAAVDVAAAARLTAGRRHTRIAATGGAVDAAGAAARRFRTGAGGQ